MMLDVADALALILEGASGQTELQKPVMLALIFVGRGRSHRSDGYPNWTYSNRNGSNDGVGRGVDDRDGVRIIISHINSGSIWCDGYPSWTYPNRNGSKNGIAPGVDHRDEIVGEIDRHIGAGSVRRNGYPKGILICTKRDGSKHGVGRGVDHRNGALPGTGHVGSGSIWCNGYPCSAENRNGSDHRIGLNVDDREEEILLIGHVSSGSVWRDGHLRGT